MDFYWADHINFSSQAMRVDGCLKVNLCCFIKKKKRSFQSHCMMFWLQDIRYAQNGEKVAKKGRDESAVSISTADVNIINPLPKVLTCQVGFGLNRSETSEITA